MGYKLLGMVVWNGVRWFVRRKAPGRTPALGAVAAAAVAVGVALAAGARQRSRGGSTGG